jgi:phenylpropionate dioxygenase-like ring-hydroxylating dioxygenase large terminal subunit
MTAFLRNTWYAAAWSTDLRESQLIGRTIVDLPILLYRDAAGTARAIGNRCPHRFAPLDRGRLVDGVIECGYHGIRFDRSGTCVLIPGEDGRAAANMQVPAYSVEERDEIVWIWTGEGPADAARLPDVSDRLANPKFAYVTGSTHVKASYELLADNLIDPSHGQFLHGKMLKREGFFDAPHEVRQEGSTISSERVIRDVEAPAAYAPYLSDRNARVDWFTRAQWDPPGIFRLDNGVTPSGRSRDEGVRRSGLHLLTPETATTTHYFYAAVRNYLLDDPKANEASLQWQHTVFEEQDKPMLEAVQSMVGTEDFASLHPVLVAIDQPAMRIRSIMRRLIAEEQRREPTAVS